MDLFSFFICRYLNITANFFPNFLRHLPDFPLTSLTYLVSPVSFVRGKICSFPVAIILEQCTTSKNKSGHLNKTPRLH